MHEGQRAPLSSLRGSLTHYCPVLPGFIYHDGTARGRDQGLLDPWVSHEIGILKKVCSVSDEVMDIGSLIIPFNAGESQYPGIQEIKAKIAVRIGGGHCPAIAFVGDALIHDGTERCQRNIRIRASRYRAPENGLLLHSPLVDQTSVTVRGDDSRTFGERAQHAGSLARTGPYRLVRSAICL